MGGNDRIDAANGNDQLDGGAGDDTILGGGGDDVIVGGPGTDSLAGEGSGSGQFTSVPLARVRPARSAILRARPARLRSPASLMTGTSRPRSVSTAIAEVLLRRGT